MPTPETTEGFEAMKRGLGESKLVCADHGIRLLSSMDTDGDGGFIERVKPCPECRSRIRFVPKGTAPVATPIEPPQQHDGKTGNRYRSKKNAAGVYMCIICGDTIDFTPAPSGGRKPVFCTRHKNPKNRCN